MRSSLSQAGDSWRWWGVRYRILCSSLLHGNEQGCRGAADTFSARSRSSSGDELCGCRPYPCPLQDPHLGCSAFPVELCSILACVHCGVCEGPCVTCTWAPAPCHTGDAALLLDGDMKSSRGGLGGGRSSHGDRQRFTPARQGGCFVLFILFFWSRAPSQGTEGAMAQPHGGEP